MIFFFCQEFLFTIKETSQGLKRKKKKKRKNARFSLLLSCKILLKKKMHILPIINTDQNADSSISSFCLSVWLSDPCTYIHIRLSVILTGLNEILPLVYTDGCLGSETITRALTDPIYGGRASHCWTERVAET